MIPIQRQRRPTPGIDMAPLIDCVFQLLIFFMLTSSYLTPMIRLTLPHAAAADTPEAQEIVVSVDELGTIFVNTQMVHADELKTVLTPLIAASRHKVITFRGDEKAPYEWFVRVLDAARASGAINIHIAHRAPM